MDSEVTASHAIHHATTHDFVNSLSSVRSLIDLLVEYPGLNTGDRKRFISMIRDETERLVRLMARLDLTPNSRISL